VRCPSQFGIRTYHERGYDPLDAAERFVARQEFVEVEFVVVEVLVDSAWKKIEVTKIMETHYQAQEQV